LWGQPGVDFHDAAPLGTLRLLQKNWSFSPISGEYSVLDEKVYIKKRIPF